MSDCRISTELGNLKATVREDADYPGIDIRLERGNQDVLLAWVEVDRVQATPMLQMRLYASMEDDEPTDSHALIPAEVDRYFAAYGGDDENDADNEDSQSEQNTTASWTGYCQYLKDWANSHSDVGFAGCCPVCYDEFLSAEWHEYKDRMKVQEVMTCAKEGGI